MPTNRRARIRQPLLVGSDYGYYFFSSQPFLRVDANGERFHNESAPYDFVMNAMTKIPKASGPGIRYGTRTGRKTYSVSIRWAAPPSAIAKAPTTMLFPDHDGQRINRNGKLREAGYIVKADTLEELAEKLGFADEKKEAFLATCELGGTDFSTRRSIPTRQRGIPSFRVAHRAVLCNREIMRTHPVYPRRHRRQ